MKLTATDVDISTLIISPEQEAPRTAGCHVSAVINYLAVQLGRRDNAFSRDDLDHFALLGRLFEVVLAATMFPPPRYERLGELVVDDVIGSPDAYDTVDDKVVEIKATWRSSKHDIVSRREYFWQLMAYCYMTQTLKATLVVLYVCGKWGGSITPEMKRYEIKFTPAELQQNWQMICRNREMA